MTAMHSPLRDVLLLGPVMRKAASNAAVCIAAAAFEQGGKRAGRPFSTRAAQAVCLTRNLATLEDTPI